MKDAVVNYPPRLKRTFVNDVGALLQAKGAASDTAIVLIGMVFMQGSRLRFVTAMPIDTYLKIVRDPALTVAQVNANVEQMDRKVNRPTDGPHRKAISNYIKSELGHGERAELGGFTINYGLETHSEALNDIEAVIVGYEGGFTSAQAILIIQNPEPEFRMHVTDGAHRTRALFGIAADKNVSPEEKGNVLSNGVPVTIVFEGDIKQAHQDFADASLAKPIKDSVRAHFDNRTKRNKLTVQVVRASDLLRLRTSMTAASVNISARSNKGMLYNVQALAMFSGHMLNFAESFDARTAGYLWDTLPQYFEVFQAQDGETDPKKYGKQKLKADIMDDGRNVHRTRMGGTFVLRAAFATLIARAIFEAEARGIQPQAIFAKMGAMNWHFFNSDEDLARYEELQKVAKGNNDEANALFNPLIKPLISRMDTRFRVSTTLEQLDHVWANVCDEIWGEPSRIPNTSVLSNEPGLAA